MKTLSTKALDMLKPQRLATLVVMSLAVAPTLAQESNNSVEGVTQAQQVFEGEVVGTPYSIVRSGPSENYYPVSHLQPGTKVIINGIKFDWLRVVPPEGAFSLVAKQFVDVNGATGRLKADNVNIRAGSGLNAQYATIQTKLMRGDQVTVLGEVETRDGVFLKIQPPPGAYLYIRKDLVVPVRPVVAGNMPEPRTRPVAPAAPQPSTRSSGPEMAEGGTPSRPRTPAAEPETAPRGPSQQELTAAAAQDKAEQLYDEADRAWREVMTKPLDEQPLDELLAKWEALATNPDLPITLRKQAITTVGFIRARAETKKELMEIKKSQDELAAKLAPLRAQNEQLQNKFRQLDMTTYTAVGQLQTSTLQEGGHALLRLVDPQTSHTLVYIRSADGSLVGQFVGVKGEIARDTNLRIDIIAAKSIVTISPDSVGKGISAEIMPPSMRPAPSAPSQP